jgi:hypothetical protein
VTVSAVSGLVSEFAFEHFLSQVHRGADADRGDPFISLAAVTSLGWLASAIAVVLFLVWVYRAAANVALLESPIAVRPGEVVVAYFIPILNLFRPYQAMKAIYRGSDPTPLGDLPAFRDRTDPDYRGGAREAIAPPQWAFRAPILGWWLLYVLRPVPVVVPMAARGMGIAPLLGNVWDVAAAVACVLVIRSVDARQRERCRRLEAMHRSS